MLFNEGFRTVRGAPTLGESASVMRGYPQFFRAGLDMAYRLAPFTIRRFLDAALDDAGHRHGFRYVSIDSRTAMLMPAMYPCIPGWHCDDFYRDETGQPDLVNVAAKAPSVHYAAVLDDGTGSLTEYMTEPWEAWTDGVHLFGRQPHDTQTLYEVANGEIEGKDTLRRRTVTSGEIVRFDPLCWHRGMPATGPGWRHFVRLTLSNHYEPKDEIRTQTQVYVTEPFKCW